MSYCKVMSGKNVVVVDVINSGSLMAQERWSLTSFRSVNPLLQLDRR